MNPNDRKTSGPGIPRPDPAPSDNVCVEKVFWNKKGGEELGAVSGSRSDWVTLGEGSDVREWAPERPKSGTRRVAGEIL